MKLKALGYRIIVKPDNLRTKTDWGLELVMDEKLEKAAIYTGTVMDIGPLAWKDYNKNYTDKPWCEVGDKVLFSKYGGTWIYDPETWDVNNLDAAVEYIVLDDADVLCKVGD